MGAKSGAIGYKLTWLLLAAATSAGFKEKPLISNILARRDARDKQNGYTKSILQ
jgi:hypothetical protein